ncbi:MAG TPA: signal peptidase I [Pyrinomonadaceae bacterium]|nr:signal peptidase I [Pyrinomonadaceae bacterium]
MRRTILRLLIFALAGVIAFYLIGWGIFYAAGGRSFYVPTGSMSNTVLPGDTIIGRKYEGEVKRGQVVVVQYPDDPTYYLSRVVGLPNETIEVREKQVYVNGRALDEERVLIEMDPGDGRELKEISTEGTGPYRVYYQGERNDESPEFAGPLRLPAGSFFVMGDNRDNSMDSRYRGPVRRELIWGDVFLITYSTTIDTNELRWNRILKRIR